MHIKVTNIRDFIGFIITTTQNGEKFPKVIHGHQKAPASIVTSADDEYIYTKFVFALFTTQLSVIYADKVLTEKYDEIFEQLSDYRNRDDNFRIQIFENVNYDPQKQQLIIEKELEVI